MSSSSAYTSRKSANGSDRSGGFTDSTDSTGSAGAGAGAGDGSTSMGSEDDSRRRDMPTSGGCVGGCASSFFLVSLMKRLSCLENLLSTPPNSSSFESSSESSAPGIPSSRPSCASASASPDAPLRALGSRLRSDVSARSQSFCLK